MVRDSPHGFYLCVQCGQLGLPKTKTLQRPGTFPTMPRALVQLFPRKNTIVVVVEGLF
jgi:hypothetical protein